MIRIAILDDYQNVSLKMDDWSLLAGRAAITVFNGLPCPPQVGRFGPQADIRTEVI